jgi:hypothetical protein
MFERLIRGAVTAQEGSERQFVASLLMNEKNRELITRLQIWEISHICDLQFVIKILRPLIEGKAKAHVTGYKPLSIEPIADYIRDWEILKISLDGLARKEMIDLMKPEHEIQVSGMKPTLQQQLSTGVGVSNK